MDPRAPIRAFPIPADNRRRQEPGPHAVVPKFLFSPYPPPRSVELIKSLANRLYLVRSDKQSVYVLEPALLPVLQNLVCRIVPGRTGNAPSGMRACAAQIQAINRSSILRPSRHGAHEEQLFKP